MTILPDSATLGLFLLAALTLNLTPGPDMLYVFSRSLGQGQKAGVVSAIGIGIGGLVHTGAAAGGISTLLHSSALAYSIVKYAGAAYLIYLGVRTIFSRHPKLESSIKTLASISLSQIFAQAIATSILNPKVALFFLAFLPQFADPNKGAVAGQIAILGIIFSCSGTIVNTSVALLSGTVGNWIEQRPQFSVAQNWFTGSIFIALGTHVAFADRR